MRKKTLRLERMEKTHLCALYGVDARVSQIETALLSFRNFLKAMKI